MNIARAAKVAAFPILIMALVGMMSCVAGPIGPKGPPGPTGPTSTEPGPVGGVGPAAFQPDSSAKDLMHNPKDLVDEDGDALVANGMTKEYMVDLTATSLVAQGRPNLKIAKVGDLPSGTD